jgi:hypothetical protein
LVEQQNMSRVVQARTTTTKTKGKTDTKNKTKNQDKKKDDAKQPPTDESGDKKFPGEGRKLGS